MQLGYSSIVWLTIAKFFTYGQILLSVIVGFMRPDFLTQAAVALAIYWFYFPEKVKRNDFRYLTFALGLSIVYDLIWVLFITDYGDINSSEDGREASVRLFSLRVCYVSLVWRVSIMIH